MTATVVPPRRRAAAPPDDVGLEQYLARDVEVVPRLRHDVAAEGGLKRLLECDRYEVLEQPGHVEQKAVHCDRATIVIHRGHA
jgi:hypothetical protein